MLSIPFGVWVFPHRIADGVHLLPAFPPLMCIALLRAHVYNLEVVSPLLGILLLVFDAVSLNGPFARPFPFHDTSALVCREDNNVFAATAEHGRSPVHSV